MKIVFFGSGNFAIPILQALLAGKYDVVCAVTQPDKRAGRHLQLTHPPVKTYCLEFNLLVFQPDNLHGDKIYDYLKRFNADLFVVVSYGRIIPKKIIDLPKIFSLNVHASLLPKYRGAAPINRAIINGEEITGVSIIKMNEFMDRGQIIMHKSLSVSDSDNAQSLSDRLAKLGKDAIIQVLDSIKNKKFSLTEQDEKYASYAPKLTKQDGLIDWKRKGKDIFNQIRGLVPWPGSYTYFNNKILKIWKVQYPDSKDCQIDSSAKFGQIVDITSDSIIIRCRDSVLAIKEVQIESGKRMSVYDFVVGHKIKKGDLLG